MTDLAKLVVRLEAQTAQYMAQLDKANARLQKFDKTADVSAKRIAKGVAAAAVAAGVAFGAMALQAISAADDLGKMAQSSGIAVESLSQLEFAAKMSNTSLEQVALGLNKLSRAAVDAARNADGKAAKAFDALGVSVKNADGSMRGTEDILLDIADKFSKLENGIAKTTLAQELFGKSGTKLIPFLNEGRIGIEKLKKEADALGLTISGKTAAAADQFNDNLDRMKFAAKGVTNQVVEEMLPMLTVLSERFVKSAKSGGALDFAVKALSVTLKTLVTAGVIVSSVFESLGRMVYGVGAAIVRIAHGDFKLAADEIKDAFNTAVADTTDSIETIAMIWGDAVPEMEKTAEEMDDAFEDTIIFNDEKAGDAAKKAAEAALESLQGLAQGVKQQVDTYGMAEGAVIRYRLAVGDLADEVAAAGPASQVFVDQIIRQTDEMERLKKETEASEEKQRAWDSAVEEGRKVTEAVRTPVEIYGDTIERLNALLAEGHIIHDTYNRAVEAAQEVFDKATKKQNKFLEEANRNVQDILATGLETALSDGVKKGAKGALDAFVDMLNKMAFQAIAAKLAEKIFGGEGMGSGGGWLGTAMNFLGGVFGGTRDAGGRGQKGHAYMIGTGAQPEMFVPDQPGQFFPAGTGMGGQKVTQNIYVQGRVDQRSARQLELEASRRQRTANARLG